MIERKNNKDKEGREMERKLRYAVANVKYVPKGKRKEVFKGIGATGETDQLALRALADKLDMLASEARKLELPDTVCVCDIREVHGMLIIPVFLNISPRSKYTDHNYVEYDYTVFLFETTIGSCRVEACAV